MRAETSKPSRRKLRQEPLRLRLWGPPLRLPGPRTKKRTSCSMVDAAPLLTAAVVTVSDSCARGERQDRSGPAVAQFLEKCHFTVVARELVPDESIQIQNLLI